MKYITLLLAVLVTACTPQQRLNRLLRKHPELTRTDTVFTTVTIPADTLVVTQPITLDADTVRLRAITDSLFHLLTQHPDTSVKGAQTARDVVYEYLTRVVPGAVQFPADTFVYYDGSLRVDMWFDGGDFKGRVVRKEESVEVPTAVHSVTAKRGVALWVFIAASFIAFCFGRWWR